MFLAKILELFFGASAGGETSASASADNGAKKPFTIVVTLMAGPGGDAAFNAVVSHLSNRPGVTIRPVHECPVQRPIREDLTELNGVLKACWNWIDRNEADLAIWGETEGSTLRLRFVPHDTGGDGNDPALSFADSLILPAEINDSHADLIYAAALSSVMPRNALQEKEQKRLLSGALVAFDRFLSNPVGLDAHQVEQTRIVGAAIATFIAIERSDVDRLHLIVATLRDVLAKMNKDASPITWMVANRHLGDALLSIVSRNKDIVGLEESSKAYAEVTNGAALQVLPHEWAEAKARLGKVMFRLAVDKPDMSLLRDSVSAYKSALTVFTKTVFPYRWAEMQNSLGQVLATYGEASGNMEAMDQASKLFQNVLLVRTKESSPHMWAATQNNLGAVKFSYGKRKEDITALREAAECFRTALEIYTKLNITRTIHVTSNNLVRVERMIGAWEAKQGGPGGTQPEAG